MQPEATREKEHSNVGRWVARGVLDATAFAGGLILTGNPAIALEAAQMTDKAVQYIPDDWANVGIGEIVARGNAPPPPPVPSVEHRYLLRAPDGTLQRGKAVPGGAPPVGGGATRHMVSDSRALPLYINSPPAINLFGFAQARASGLPYTPPARIGVQVTAR